MKSGLVEAEEEKEKEEKQKRGEVGGEGRGGGEGRWGGEGREMQERERRGAKGMKEGKRDGEK